MTLSRATHVPFCAGFALTIFFHLLGVAPPPLTLDSQLKQAWDLLLTEDEEADPQAAAALFNEVIAACEDADGEQKAVATAGLLKCLMVADDMDMAAKVAATLESKPFGPYRSNPDVSKFLAEYALQCAAGADGDSERQPIAELEALAEGGDLPARVQLARQLFGSDNSRCISEALRCIKDSQKTENGDDAKAALEAAQKLLVQVFDALGNNHVLVKKARRRLANLMFA